MAFVNRVLIIVPSMGQPLQNDALFLKTVAATGVGTISTALAGLTPAIKNGYIRFKLSASSGAGTLTSWSITVTDGTTTEVVATETTVAAQNSFASPQQIVRTVPFLSDLAVTQVNVITVIATAGGLLDIEVGATN